MSRQSFACDLETMERLAEYEAEYQERYFLPVDSARKGAIRREIERRWTVAQLNDLLGELTELSVKINDEAARGHIDRDLANTAVAALTALSKSINV
nr:MAG TPA: hypothetical protein [Caudoviricetes sp.]